MDVLRALIIRLSVDIHHVTRPRASWCWASSSPYARRWLDTHGRIVPGCAPW